MSASFTSLAGSISAVGLTRRFGDTLAVDRLTLSADAGSVTGIIGPNGSGKSTFLRLLVGLVRPDRGEAVVDGVELAGDGTAVRRRCTYAPGELSLYGELRGGEHLAWFLRGRREALPRARELASELGLPLDAKVHAYSHGMKRQLLFVAALAPDVRVRILDEPTEGLDPSKRGIVLGLLADDVARGTTVLLSSHHLGEVDHSCDRLVFFHQGRLLADESPAALRERARRLVHLSFAEGPELSGGADLDLLARRLEALGPRGSIEVARRGRRLVVSLAQEDPRAFLRALAEAPDLPPPATLEYGQLGLRDLYRDLYGVEGL